MSLFVCIVESEAWVKASGYCILRSFTVAAPPGFCAVLSQDEATWGGSMSFTVLQNLDSFLELPSTLRGKERGEIPSCLD